MTRFEAESTVAESYIGSKGAKKIKRRTESLIGTTYYDKLKDIPWEDIDSYPTRAQILIQRFGGNSRPLLDIITPTTP